MDKNSIGVILIYVAFMAVLILPTYFSNKKKKQQKAALLESLKVGEFEVAYWKVFQSPECLDSIKSLFGYLSRTEQIAFDTCFY